ncbi:DEAD/DEAH box helicase [Collinsella ihumii]|uniref:DEAD/DEAH box helicase n=1 Tax=Collinsella ihumii TaxID=1720204 RepID=UPI0025AA41FF|nr:DEAD/DEAH box helicase family protein [Collinsella ihumii]MDN0056352.1 DEAD/DEAH box helicase family protein [Collinsella ihumii]
MELKQYQRAVLDDVARFAKTYAMVGDAATAYGIYMNAAGKTPGKNGIPKYHDDLGGVPKVCAKVPTGGGKTFIGACAIDVLSDVLPAHDDVVVWLVPRKEILSQTLRNMRNPEHFLRIRLDQDFAGRVEVLDKEDGLRGRGFNAATFGDGLKLFVLSYDSFKNRDGRRAFAENSALDGLTAQQRAAGMAVDIENADETALISALAGSNPIVIVDESHHAGSSLSLDMLRNLNPRFVLELTATPDPRHANVITQAGARQLKREEMVKLPVVVYRRQDKQAVVTDAVMLQRRLEAIAGQDERRTGRYIRPIVLFQAERRGPDDAETFQKLKDKLVGGGIPAEQIAIRTGDVDELGGADLMSRDCPIRYIITVEALSEGWDCPFAYVLATVANKTSAVSVEQIVGRVLRQPYVTRAAARCLNMAYVLTASNDFDETVRQVVRGLNGVGFSQEDVVANDLPVPEQGELELQTEQPQVGGGDVTPDADDARGLTDDLELHFPGLVPTGGSDSASGTSIDDIIDASEDIEKRFDDEAEQEGDANPPLGGLGGDVNTYKIREANLASVEELLLPQFQIKVDGGLFTDDEIWKPLDRDDLLEGFKLSKYGIDRVKFDVDAFSDARAVDLSYDSDDFKVRRVQDEVRKNLRMLFSELSDEGRRSNLEGVLYETLSSQFKNTYGEGQLKNYIARVVADMDQPTVDGAFDSISSVIQAIRHAVISYADDYCLERFEHLLDGGGVRLAPSYRFPSAVNLSRATTMYDRTLYEAESDDMNDALEKPMAELLANSPAIAWWHRVRESKDYEFKINGSLTHYPDFIAMRTDGIIMAIETKGGQLIGEDSTEKLKLGRRWADMAGSKFRYFMVFNDEKLKAPGSFTMAEFSSYILG